MNKEEFVHYAKSLRAELIKLATSMRVPDPDAIVQDVFLSTANNRNYVNVSAVEADARAYFFSAVHKRGLGSYRVRTGRAVVAPMVDLDDVADTAAHNPYPVLDTKLAVDSALESLEDQETAEALRLVYGHEYTVAEAAKILGANPSTLYKRIQAALPKLRAILAPEYGRKG